MCSWPDLSHSPPEGDNWLYELKYDGYRIVAYAEAGGVRLTTRGGHDFTRRFQEVTDAIAVWSRGRAMVLDGEMVITDATGPDGFPGAAALHEKPRQASLSGMSSSTCWPWTARTSGHGASSNGKETLEALLTGAPDNLYYSPHVRGQGEESFRAACLANMEGIVAKRADSAYSGTRNGDWIKLKCDNRQEFVIGGFTRTDKKAEGISALLLGFYDGPDLIYTGRAGTGLSARCMKDLAEKFDKIKRPTPPFRRGAETEVQRNTHLA